MGDLKRLVRETTAGFDPRGLQKLFEREAAEAYQILSGGDLDSEPGGKGDRLVHRTRLLFFGITNKLKASRRLLFLASLGFFVLGLLKVFSISGLDIGEQSEALHLEIAFEASPLFFILSFGCLLFLFVLELVDRVRVRDELEVARQLQSALLPHGDLSWPGYCVAHSYRTANTVGGDYYDFLPLDDERIAVVVGDASGHGIAAGLVMAIAQATLGTAIDLDSASEAVVPIINRAIYRTGDRRTFMSLFYGRLDPDTGRLEHFGAGHPYPLLRRADGRIDELGRGKLPLGVRSEIEVEPAESVLGHGDTLILFSDGLPEAVDSTGKSFGFERIRELAEPGGTPQQIHDRILLDFERHLGEETLNDDLTLVVIRREEALPPLPIAS